MDGEKAEVTKSWLGEVWEWTYCILLAVILTLLVKNLLFSTTIVRKESMLQTLHDGDILYVDRLSQVRNVPLKRGEIVVIEAPSGSARAEDGANYAYYPEISNLFEKIGRLFKKTLYIKRVIGLPGEHLSIDGDDVYIDGEKIEESYTNPDRKAVHPNYDMDVVIPEGYIFCIGDNRDYSLDSRYFGLIPVNKVEGRALFRFFPFNKMGKM